MAGDRISRYITNRRVHRIICSPSFQILSISIFLLLCLRWLISRSNEPHDPLLLPVRPRPTASVESRRIDWSKLYYVQYVRTPEELCNAVIMWSEIEEIGSRGQRMMIYPSEWRDEFDADPKKGLSTIARLLQNAAKHYYVKLHPLEVLNRNHPAHTIWSSYTNLLAYNLTELNRVLLISTKSVVLQNLDELFLLPKASLAMPYVYFGPPSGWQFSTHIMLVRPSTSEFSQIDSAIKSAKPDSTEFDIISQLFPGQVLRIPQRPFSLLSGEFRRQHHDEYLGSSSAKWDPDKALGEAKSLHFSDWPIPKPWLTAPKDLLNRHMPKCDRKEWFGATDCRDRTLWLELYDDFKLKRRTVCGVEFELTGTDQSAMNEVERGEWRFGVGGE